MFKNSNHWKQQNTYSGTGELETVTCTPKASHEMDTDRYRQFQNPNVPPDPEPSALGRFNCRESANYVDLGQLKASAAPTNLDSIVFNSTLLPPPPVNYDSGLFIHWWFHMLWSSLHAAPHRCAGLNQIVGFEISLESRFIGSNPRATLDMLQKH